MERNDAISLVDSINEFQDLNTFMDDEELTITLAYVVKMMLNPQEVKHQDGAAVLLRLQAYSFKFGALGTAYATYKKGPAGSDANHKKNMYKTISEKLDRLVDALKYSVRN